MNDRLDDAAIQLQNLATRLLRLARADHAKQGLGSAQYSALAVLHDRGSLSLVELAQTERVSHATMSRVVAGLEKMGAVERVADTSDRRVRRVEITDAGRMIYEQVSEKRIAIMRAVLSQLRPETVDDVLSVVRQVASAREKAH